VARGTGNGGLPRAPPGGPELTRRSPVTPHRRPAAAPAVPGGQAGAGSGGAGLPPRYWRPTTYDTYTAGWDNNTLESHESANRLLVLDLPPGQDLVSSSRSCPGLPWNLSVNTPYRVDAIKPGGALKTTRWPRLVQMDARPGVTPLCLVSRAVDRACAPPAPADGHPSPGRPLGRYLALPTHCRPRAWLLPRQSAARRRATTGARHRGYLRRYPTTSICPSRRTSRDLVDYFLFDGKRATATITLRLWWSWARGVACAAGVPAMPGTFDYDQERGPSPKRTATLSRSIRRHRWWKFGAGRPAAGPGAPRGEDVSPGAAPLPARTVRWGQQFPGHCWAGASRLVLALIAWAWWPRPSRTGRAGETLRPAGALAAGLHTLSRWPDGPGVRRSLGPNAGAPWRPRSCPSPGCRGQSRRVARWPVFIRGALRPDPLRAPGLADPLPVAALRRHWPVVAGGPPADADNPFSSPFGRGKGVGEEVRRVLTPQLPILRSQL